MADSNKIIALQLEAELHAAFPGTRFECALRMPIGSLVRFVNVEWHEGPSREEVAAITGKYHSDDFVPVLIRSEPCVVCGTGRALTSDECPHCDDCMGVSMRKEQLDGDHPSYWDPDAAEAVQKLREAFMCMTTEDAEQIADCLTDYGIQETRVFLAREIEENAYLDKMVDWVLRKIAARRAQASRGPRDV